MGVNELVKLALIKSIQKQLRLKKIWNLRDC